MKIFVITDTHFGHRALVEEFNARPGDFEQQIVRNWRSLIGNDDLVIHLGDVVVGQSSDWTSVVPSLPGRKVLVLGNHDKKSINWYLNNGIDFCCSRFEWDAFGVKILFTHEPVFDRAFDLNIHGHLHTGRHRELRGDERHHLLSLEETSYQPRLLESIVKTWKKSKKPETDEGK